MATQEELRAAMEGMTREQKLAFLDKYEEMNLAASAAPEEPGFREKVGEFINKIPGVEAASRKAAEFLGIEPGAPASETAEVLMDLPLPNVGALQPFGSMGEATEALPAAGAAVGSLGGPAGIAAGGAAGEMTRQAFREALGLAPATGLIQQMTGMDPESLEARATGVAAEAAMGPAGEVVAPLAGPLLRSARRSAQNLVKLPEKILTKELKRGGTKGKEILDRFVEEGIPRPASRRGTQVARAEKKLQESSADAEALHTALADEQLPEGRVDEVLKTLEEALPKERPGGPPRLGGTQAKNAESALDDAVGFISEAREAPGGLTLSRARGEKQRLSEEISSLFESGADTPLAKKALERSHRAWQKAINESFPELGAADLRRSDLITINKYLKKAMHKSEMAGADLSAEGVSAGAMAAGRWSVPFMIFGKAGAMATAGPISSLSGSGKRLLAKVVSEPAMTQTWLRLMAQLPRTEESE